MMEMFICGVCGGPVTSITHDDGWTNWSCPCGRTMGVRAPYGELDLGVVRRDPEGPGNQFDVFYEEFTSVTETGCDSVVGLEAVEKAINVCLGEVVEQEP
jgi:hypothetical protein